MTVYSKARDIMQAMTPEEKISLLTGTGMPGFDGTTAVIGETNTIVPGAAGTTKPIPHLDIPAIVMADGPAGVRISPTREGTNDTFYCTAFPAGTLIASTWNINLVDGVGRAMGREALDYGIDILLAPALNIHRNPLCGRNFEYYSEDPYLSGKIAVAMVNGVEAHGVGTSIKHFAVNNQETNRTNSDSRLTTRALREIYLKGFEIVVKEAQPKTVMSSYNYINGTYASESYDLLTTILRDEWGYKGVVMTDWFGGKNAPAQVHAGNDLMMPGSEEQENAIRKAIEEETLSIEDVDRNVTRIIEMILRTPRFKKHKNTNKPDLTAHATITRQAASEGMILLKNENNTLPLSPSIKNIAVFGITSYEFIAGGTGSGDVNKAYTVSLIEGLQNNGYTTDEELTELYKNYREKEKAKLPVQDNPFMKFFPPPHIPEFIPDPNLITEKAGTNDIAVITIGRSSGEFADRTLKGDFLLTNEEKELIRIVKETFIKEGKRTIVILNTGGVIETASWKDIPDGILLAWLPGQEGGNSVADLLSGKVTPSGKLTMSFPVEYKDIPSAENFPYNYPSDPQTIMVNLMGHKPKDTCEKNIDYTFYEEDIFVGYRYYNTFGKQVSYPFGYGLSYTNFIYDGLIIIENDDQYIVDITIRNNGQIAGKEIVQLYISAPDSTTLKKPAKELKGFTKTRLLQPGDGETVSFTFTTADLASFNEEESAWITDAGIYTIAVAASCEDIRETSTIQIEKTQIIERVNRVLLPQDSIHLLLE